MQDIFTSENNPLMSRKAKHPLGTPCGCKGKVVKLSVEEVREDASDQKEYERSNIDGR